MLDQSPPPGKINQVILSKKKEYNDRVKRKSVTQKPSEFGQRLKMDKQV